MLFLLSQAAQSTCQAQSFHENPDSVAPVAGTSDESKLQLYLTQMMLESYFVAYNINSSKPEWVEKNMVAFDSSYLNYQMVLRNEKLSDSKYNFLDVLFGDIQRDLKIWAYESARYDSNYKNYSEYMSRGDAANATPYAIKLRDSYQNLTKSNSSMASSVPVVIRALNDTNLPVTPLNYSAILFANYTDRLIEQHIAVDELLDRTNLSLVASQSAARAGDNVTFTATLHTDGIIPLDDQKINFYVNDQYAGTGFLDSGGKSTLTYTVPAEKNRLRVHGEFKPDNPRLVPVNSSALSLPVEEKPTTLSLHAAPGNVTYGDTLGISGTLLSSDGSGVAGKTVDLYVEGTYVGSSNTSGDGTYTYAYPVSALTPGGFCTVYAQYIRSDSDDIYLNSSPVGSIINVLVQDTIVTFETPSNTLAGGDTALFYGTLKTSAGMPVSNVTVGLYDDGRFLGSCMTDINGYYNTSLMIPYSAEAGDSMFSAAITSSGKALNRSAGGRLIPVSELNASITGNTAPSLLFSEDTMYLHGSFVTGNGKPMAQQILMINLANQTNSTYYVVRTDDEGNYKFFRKIKYEDQFYTCNVSVLAPDYPKVPVYFAGETQIVPYNKLAIGLMAIISLVIAGFIVFKVSGVGRIVVKDPARRRLSADRKNRFTKPVIYARDLEAPVREVPPIDFVGELKIIADLIDVGQYKEAMTRVYLVTRGIAIENDVAVKGSVTHRELYPLLALKYPLLSKPLERIILLYERVSFGRARPGRAEASLTVESLNELHQTISSRPEEESLQ